jgi:two-component system response regulator AlgR
MPTKLGKHTAIVIDDEPLARQRLSRLLLEIGVKVVAQGETGQQAIDLLAAHEADLIFLDISMPNKNGLQAASEIQCLQNPPAIVCCTAFEQYAIQAFKANAVAYLLKPVASEDLIQSIDNATRLSSLQINSLQYNSALSSQPAGLQNTSRSDVMLDNVQQQPIYLSHRGTKQKYLSNDFVYFRSVDKIIVAGHVDGQETVVDYSLKDLQLLLLRQFIRLHRNCLVNREYLIKLTRDDDGLHYVYVGDSAAGINADQGKQHKFVVSRRHLTEVKQCFQI